jgi:rhamnulokinase
VAPRVFAAVDLGASGGRVVAGVVEDGSVSLRTVHRFPNRARELYGRLRWPIQALYGEVQDGLARLAGEYPEVESVGVDTWGIDYGLLDSEGRLLAPPVSYRDDRTAKVIDAVHEKVPPKELFAVNGLQFLPFNTIYQLEAEQRGSYWARATSVVLLPDLIAFWLTGELRTERTNASTTGLLDVRTGEWSPALMDRLGVPPALLAPLVSPGTVLGPIRKEICARLGLPHGAVVTAVGSHDTASAVAGVPAATDRFAYASSGTWSLVGVELKRPVLTDWAREENFTNEAGVEGRIRFLRNTGGFWLVQESLRAWAERGEEHDLERLLSEAAGVPGGRTVINVDDPSFLAPGPMPERVASAAVRAGQPRPRTSAQVIRCILDSLARAYGATVLRSAALSGREIEVLHLVGGGSRSPLLCQAAADAAGLTVIAGPAEATALGNVVVQAQTHGALPRSLDETRAMLAARLRLGRYEPGVSARLDS